MQRTTLVTETVHPLNAQTSIKCIQVVIKPKNNPDITKHIFSTLIQNGVIIPIKHPILGGGINLHLRPCIN
jgi:hypothetical protein